MHWARANVNPLVSLRAILGSERWTAAWPRIWQTWRGQARQQTVARRAARLALVPAPPAPVPEASIAPPPPPAPTAATPPRPKLVVDGKPTSGHPWKQGLPLRRVS